MRLVDAEQMRFLDSYTIEKVGVASLVLMENAARSWVSGAQSYLKKTAVIYVLCGSGNNGGDGYAIARILVNEGYCCQVVTVSEPKSKDCIANAQIWGHFGTSIHWDEFVRQQSEKNDTIIIDAILGTGVERPITGHLAEVVAFINSSNALVLAVDMPTGINTSTGDMLGLAVQAEATITFQLEKVGQYFYPGKTYCGNLISTKISIQEIDPPTKPAFELITSTTVKELKPEREPNTYKNRCGHLLLLCGAKGTMGAAYLSSLAGIKGGAGLVTAAIPKSTNIALFPNAPECMLYNQENVTLSWLQKFNAAAVGCGLGRQKKKWEKIVSMLNRLEYPVVLDADAFFGIENWEFLDHRFILTPHPGEFAAMTGYRRPVSNKEQIEQVLSFTRKTKAVLVLKGAPTIVAQGGEVVYINSTGNSGMATAGSGDVLAGLIGSLLAQGIAPKNAALLGVWLHGKAGDLALSNESKESLTANSIIQNLGSAFLSLT